MYIRPIPFISKQLLHSDSTSLFKDRSALLLPSLSQYDLIRTMVFDRYPVTQPAEGTFAANALRNNSKGTDLDKEALGRFKIREICEGWGNYRDAAEYVLGFLSSIVDFKTRRR